MGIQDAARDKVFAAEKNVAIVRTAVIYFNILVYLTILDSALKVPWLAWTIIIVAGAYGPLVSWLQPWRRYEVFLSSYFTSITDATLIALWILGTGSFHSPFYVLWYVSLVAVAFRYDSRTTLWVAGAYAATYVGVLAIIGQLSIDPAALAVRVGYIFLIGALGALIARETYAQIRGRVEMTELAEMSKAISGAPPLEDALRRIVDTARGLTGSDRAAVYLLDGDGNSIVPAYAHGLSEAYLRTVVQQFKNLPGYDVATGDGAVHVPDAREEERLKPIREMVVGEGFRTYAVFPMVEAEKRVGALALYRNDVRPFSPDDLAVGANLANHAVTAIQASRLLQELRDSEERFRAVSETANDAIVSTDAAGSITYVNDAACDLFGYTQAELRGRHLTDLMGERFREPHRQGLETYVRDGQSAIVGRTVEVEGLRKDGTVVPVELSLAASQSGQGTFFTGILRDISERIRAEEQRIAGMQQMKELERLKELDEFKTQFINTAAHELGTPLTPLRLQVHLLKDERKGNLTDAQKRSMEILDRNLERLISLVRDVLEGARLQADRLGIRKESMDMNRVVLEAVESFAAQAKTSQIELTTSITPDLVVNADAKRVTQVLFNLLSNAMKFTPPGGRIRVTTDRMNDMAIVRVSDSGIGIPPDKLPKLFRPFSQVHDTMQRKDPGTGLGLYICKGIVELHGGRMWAESPGERLGTTFTFAIPFGGGERADLAGRAARAGTRREEEMERRLQDLV